MTSKYKSR